MHTTRVSYAVELPEEPPDRAVVLDRCAYAWQRHGVWWWPIGEGSAGNMAVSWAHLLVDGGPLTPLITVDDCPGELTDEQRDDALAAGGQAIDYREHDARIETLKPTRAFPAGDEG